jgi:serine/threonine-protein kinase
VSSRPDRIGPFRVQETVAEDALTVTYRVEDPGLGRALWLRTARGTAPPIAVRDRLLREAKIVAPLAHPGVITLHGLVRKDDAVHLLFEDVRGPRIDALSARLGRLAPAQAVAVAWGLAEALAHMHARGLVHGGLRPDRVALTLGGGVKLFDLSTAHATGGSGATDDEPLRPPEYLAPEQILDEDEGPRADVFSTGVLLFELLTGKRPWDDPPKPPPNPDTLAPAEVSTEERHALAHRIRNAPPPELTTTDGPPTALVARIVSRCLAKDPADRYPDAAALAEELSDALRELSVEPPEALVLRALAAADFVPERPPKTARGPAELSPPDADLRRLVSQLATIFGLIVLGALVTEWSRAGERPAPPPSETPSGARGYLRVLAQPWAEVTVDGEKIDTTPMARLIPVATGRHFVTFTHPNAPEEKRTVNVVTGQTVLVDVTMRIDHPRKDAGVDAGPVDETP